MGERLDKYLQLNGYTTSRNSSLELIKRSKVKVNSKIVTKPSFKIDGSESIEILEEFIYVSRAAYKLKSFLKNSDIEIYGKECLDIGSSSGGFIQILCEYGAKSVTGVDVGRGQLSHILKDNPKVTNFENIDIRDFKSRVRFDFVTCDVSFIGVAYILDDIDRLSSSEILILFKPQFEVGKEAKRDRRGVVEDTKALKLSKTLFEDRCKEIGWRLIKKEYSSLKGKDGNEEIFYYFQK